MKLQKQEVMVIDQTVLLMPKTCDLVPLCPPYYPCTCATKCDCLCHGRQDKPKTRSLPSDPDHFNTTNRGFYKPLGPDDYSNKKFIPTDNLGTDPNILPLTTEMKREYTPKKADRDKPVKPRGFRQNAPFDGTTTFGDTFKAPGEDDYPERVRQFTKPMKSEPGKYDTTYRTVYVKPGDDMYTPSPGPKERAYRPSVPGIYDTEYRTEYIDFPRDRSLPFKGTPMTLGTRPTDYTTTTRGTYRAPGSDDYPTRERAFQTAPKTGPLSRTTSTNRETYRDPGPPEDPLTSTRPSDSKLIVGPTSPMQSTTHRDFGPKKHFCCGCSSH